MESYLRTQTVGSIDVPIDEEGPIQATIRAVDSVTDMMKQLLSRIDKLEEHVRDDRLQFDGQRPKFQRNRLQFGNQQPVCWNCQQQGHIARFCKFSK